MSDLQAFGYTGRVLTPEAEARLLAFARGETDRATFRAFAEIEFEGTYWSRESPPTFAVYRAPNGDTAVWVGQGEPPEPDWDLLAEST